MAGDRTIFDEPHHQSLEFIAAQALADGNIAEAFRLADRRCRIFPVPEPHCYILRAEASYQLGFKTAAIADLAKALEIAPDNVAANRRMLAWAEGALRTRAARSIIAHERNFDLLREAVRALHESGQRNFAGVTVLEDALDGWAVWADKAPLEILITNGTDNFSELFEPDAFHPLGEYGNATSFCVRRSKSTKPQSIFLSAAGTAIRSLRTAGNDTGARLPLCRPRAANAHDAPVTVIVPVYADFASTRTCLESLLDELKTSRHRAILIDDATPDVQIAEYLAALGAKPRVQVLTNARNLGFVGSVNRALDAVKQGDVILLNADTVVTRGFINRLAIVARSSPDIGTITPLSNNGEFTSFPIPNAFNPMPSREEITQIDRIAAKLNADKIIELPTGIGFCLYVTRACLDAVGSLSEDFAQGYLEDADFCLRARGLGFRSVCATSVYVGHAGSKSFGQRKRSLVVSNLAVLERRFPKYRSECGAFMAADPLQPARETIERIAGTTARRPKLLVTGAGIVGVVARERARTLASEDQAVLILEVQRHPNKVTVKIINPAGSMPQSVRFALSSSSAQESLYAFIRSLKPSGIELLDPSNIPLSLVELLLKLNVPYDIFIADGGLLDRNSEQVRAGAVRLSGSEKIDDLPGASSQTGTMIKARNRPDRWQELARGAQRILAPTVEARAFALNILPQRKIECTVHSAPKLTHAMPKSRKAALHLGFAPVRFGAHEQWLMCETARTFTGLRPDLSITVIGSTLDDIGLMRSSNVFVTGTIAAEEFEQVADALGVTNLFLTMTQPLFGHPISSVVLSSHLPIAYFDWSEGRNKPRKKDLPIPSRSSLDDLIGALTRWMAKP